MKKKNLSILQIHIIPTSNIAIGLPPTFSNLFENKKQLRSKKHSKNIKKKTGLELQRVSVCLFG
jgi:hypothetical protein